jgi:hypothetical protein
MQSPLGFRRLARVRDFSIGEVALAVRHYLVGSAIFLLYPTPENIKIATTVLVTEQTDRDHASSSFDNPVRSITCLPRQELLTWFGVRKQQRQQ